MQINVSRLGEEAIIRDLEVYTNNEEALIELLNMIEYVKVQPTNGLGIMHLLLEEIKEHGLYKIESIVDDEEFDDDLIY